MLRQVNLIKRVLRTQSIAFASTTASSKNKPIPLITCKNTKLNLMLKDVNKPKKSQEIELASKGWQHYKAKGDHFILHPVRNVVDSNLVNSKEFSELGLNEKLVQNINEKHDIKRATKLQVDAIEQLMQGNHALIAAETGCGKVC